LKKGFLCNSVICLFLFIGFAAAGSEQRFIGDVNTGSLTEAVHLIPLLDEKGRKIVPSDYPIHPFSTRTTCGDCHDYRKVRGGWHFNAIDPNINPGRPGQPWIFADASTATQIPLSYRNWPGTFKPEQLGLSHWLFTLVFGRQMPGGGTGELDSPDPDEQIRQQLAGRLEINCLACHSRNPAYDQAYFADQVTRQNWRWAAASASEFASVDGMVAKLPSGYDFNAPALMPEYGPDAPVIYYDKNIFDHKNRVFFDVSKNILDSRCNFCHTRNVIEPKQSQLNADIHLAAGMTCVSCHFNSIEHNIIRGYEGESLSSSNPYASAVSCTACHLGDKSKPVPSAGYLAAPLPKHPGIPPIHFDKLSCTACHSGPWPDMKTGRLKTSRAHALGTYGADANDYILPHIVSVVFAKDSQGKIAPHNLLWPAFWAVMKDEKIEPLNIELVRETISGVIGEGRIPRIDDWPPMNDEKIITAIKALSSVVTDGHPVYICGGKVRSLENEKLIVFEHQISKPYLWPIAHNVRPSSQSLGVRRCQDCHSTDAAFSFGDVEVDSPLPAEKKLMKKMYEFQDIDSTYYKFFAFTFVFRPWMKLTTILCSALLGFVLLLYGLKALNRFLKWLSEG
jgi:hypothetical protein